MKLWKRIEKAYDFIEEYAMVLFLAVMLLVVFVQVVLRYVFNSGLSWSEESARFLFMWIIWMSMSIGFRDKSHIRMTIISDRLTERGKKILDLIDNSLILIFSLYLAYLGWQYVGRLIHTHQTAPATKLPYALIYSCLPLSLSICSIRVVTDIIADVRRLKSDQTAIKLTND